MFLVFLAYLAVLALTGGSNRADAVQLIVLRPATVLFATAMLLMPVRLRMRRFAPLWIALGLFAATMLIQLVPMPPAWWWALPGRAAFRPIAERAGVANSWRALSLTPDATVNSLMALLPVAAVLIGMGKLDEPRQARLVPLVALVAVASAFMGLLQLLGGSGSALYFYPQPGQALPVGLLANRNHEAVFLAIALPLFAWSANSRWPGFLAGALRPVIAGVLAVLIVPSILLTGSRSGTLFEAAALPVAGGLAWWGLPADVGRRWRYLAGATIVAVLIGLLVAVTMSGRASSFHRFDEGDGMLGDRRVHSLPVLFHILTDFLPFGTGFGAFDPVFRAYEPDALLTHTYFNHAHNDLLELAITGGVPAMLVLIGFLAWMTVAMARAWRRRRQWREDPALVGACTAGLLLAASLTDYPLRAPALAGLFAIACAWLCPPLDGATERRRSGIEA